MSSGVDLRDPTVAGKNAKAAGSDAKGEANSIASFATRNLDASPIISRITAKAKDLRLSDPEVAGLAGGFAEEKVIKVLGEGSHGTVELVEKHGRTYAKKSSKKAGSLDQEIRMLAAIGRIAAFVLVPDLIEDGAIYFPVMEASLNAALKAKAIILDKQCFDTIALQTAKALDFLESKQVVHLDLKTDNILVTIKPDLLLKITDFGLSKRTGENTEFNQGTLQYMAPEHVREEIPAVPSADVYAYGVTLFKVLTSQFPFDASDEIAILFHKGEQMEESRFDLLSPMPMLLERLNKAAFEVKDQTDPRLTLITDCITKAPGDRPSARDLTERIQTIEE